MQDPYFITAERLEDALEHEYGLYHRANRSHEWTLTDLLQQSYTIDTINKLYNGVFQYVDLVVPIDGVTAGTTDKGRQLLRIPDSNLKHIRSMFITGPDTWIIWLQSKQQPERCWAWEIDVEPPGQIRAMNPQIRSEGWHIAPCTELTAHITKWYSKLYIGARPTHSRPVIYV